MVRLVRTRTALKLLFFLWLQKGMTPLHIAAKYGQLGVARLLLQRGAQPDMQGRNGLTALHVAAHYNKPNIVLLLLEEFRASPHCQAKVGGKKYKHHR